MAGPLHIATIPRASDGDWSEANARLIAVAPDMWDLIEEFGSRVTDMFEQLIRGNWTDDQGHAVAMNAAMLALKKPVADAIALRAKATGAAQ
jgi:hypothetical protein